VKLDNKHLQEIYNDASRDVLIGTETVKELCQKIVDVQTFRITLFLMGMSVGWTAAGIFLLYIVAIKGL